MLDDFDKLASELWEQKKTPLEKMYDSWMGPGNWEPPRPQTRYAIYSWDDIVWRGLQVQSGQPFSLPPLRRNRSLDSRSR